MGERPYHKRYHGDALTGFMPLTLEERGAYQTVLDMIYDRGGPLLDNERLLAGYMNCSVRKWRKLRTDLIEKGKIHLDEEGLIANGRALKQLENDAKTHRKLVESGAKGGRARAENAKKHNSFNGTGQGSLEPGLAEGSSIPLPESREEREGRARVRTKQSPEIPLPDGWVPEPFGDGSQCAGIIASWSADMLELQAEKFRAHHTAKGSRWRDWQAAWKTWVLNSASATKPSGQAPAGSFLRIVQEELAREKKVKAGG
jgi:uncharacterized protein YdaU (DUF1376 family)